MLGNVGGVGSLETVEFFRQVLRVHIIREFLGTILIRRIAIRGAVSRFSLAVRFGSFHDTRRAVFRQIEFPFFNDEIVLRCADGRPDEGVRVVPYDQSEAALIGRGKLSQAGVVIGCVDPNLGGAWDVRDGVIE